LEKNHVKVSINFSFLSRISLNLGYLNLMDSSFFLLNLAKRVLFNTSIDLLSSVKIPMEIVGFNHQVKFDVQTSCLLFDLGFSSILKVEKPFSISVVFLDSKNKVFELSSFSRREVVLYSQKIRQIKPPNLYTGHGIKYLNEVLVRKQIKK
jgi:large subunit ribosomal protein L6